MPSLSEIGDIHGVRYRYSGRTVFLVEGAGDKNAFESLVGPGYEADLEFRIAPTAAGSGGCRAVRDKVDELRLENLGNSRVFGLLDGEAAAMFDAAEVLLTSDETLFMVPQYDGFIFLGAHELENLYFSHADVCSVLASQASAARLHLHPAGMIATTLDACLMRFARASIYKYTSAHFHARQQIRAILNTKIFGSGSWVQIRNFVKQVVTSGGQLQWSDFVTELVRLGRIARSAMRACPGGAGRRGWLLRFADGKELLSRLRTVHGGIPDRVEGALLLEVCRGTYPSEFRQALFRLAEVTPSTASA